MKKILSTAYSDTAFNLGMLVLRAVLGFMLIINHGLVKISNFGQMSSNFYDPFHIGGTASLSLVIFAELFCSMFLILGLFTRLAAFVLAINLAVAVFMFHRGQPIKNMELGIVYLGGIFTLLLVGPGRVSVDGMMGK
jgi:putative oxidoreductase